MKGHGYKTMKGHGYKGGHVIELSAEGFTFFKVNGKLAMCSTDFTINCLSV